MSQDTPMVWTHPKGFRRVELSKLVPKPTASGGKTWNPEPCGTGWFHCWGLEVDSKDDCVASFTVAIVEHADGSISTWMPERVRFLDPVQ